MSVSLRTYWLTDFSYEREYHVIQSGTSNEEAEETAEDQPMSDLNVPTTLAVPTQSGSIRGNYGFHISYGIYDIYFLFISSEKACFWLISFDCWMTVVVGMNHVLQVGLEVQWVHYYRLIKWYSKTSQTSRCSQCADVHLQENNVYLGCWDWDLLSTTRFRLRGKLIWY